MHYTLYTVYCIMYTIYSILFTVYRYDIGLQSPIYLYCIVQKDKKDNKTFVVVKIVKQ